MIIGFILSELYASTIVRRGSMDNANVIVKTVSLISCIILSIIHNNPITVATCFMFPILVSILTRDPRLLIHSLKAPLIPATIIFLITLMFSPWDFMGLLGALTVFMRIMVIASCMLTYIASTNPFNIVYLCEKLKLPLWLRLSLILLWRVIPLTLLTANESYIVSRLKGDPIWRGLVSSTAVSMVRAANMVESLYVHGAGLRDFTVKPLIGVVRLRDTIYYALAPLPAILIHFIWNLNLI